MKKKKIVGKAVRVFLVLALAGCLVLFLVNLYIIRKEEKYPSDGAPHDGGAAHQHPL